MFTRERDSFVEEVLSLEESLKSQDPYARITATSKLAKIVAHEFSSDISIQYARRALQRDGAQISYSRATIWSYENPIKTDIFKLSAYAIFGGMILLLNSC
jgi:hypothetical protein